MQRFGAAFGIAIVTVVFTAHGHLGSPASVTSGYRPALMAAAAISLAGALAAAAVGRRAAPVTTPGSQDRTAALANEAA
jgi:hypothetical protein